MDREVKNLSRVISYIRERVNPDMALSQIDLFLQVALRNDEGVTMRDMENILNVSQGAVSRNVKMLSKFFETDEKGNKVLAGYDLVTVTPDLEDRRRMALYLTDRGKEVIRDLTNLLREG